MKTVEFYFQKVLENYIEQDDLYRYHESLQQLADLYQFEVEAKVKLESLLKRWNEIAPELILDSYTKRSVIEQLTQLIQDTQETLS